LITKGVHVLIEWVLAKLAGQVLMQGLVSTFIFFGVAQLGYSVLEKLIKGAQEWLLILGATVFTGIILFTPWSLPKVRWLLGCAITIAVLAHVLKAVKDKKALLEHIPTLEKHVVMLDQDGYGLGTAPEITSSG
jgi:hypothetical protein